MQWLLAGLLTVSVLTAANMSATALAAGNCQRQVSDGTGATTIVEYRGMTCTTARELVRVGDREHWNYYSKPIDGLRCRHLNVPAGGGEAACVAPHRFLKVAFE